LSEHLFLSLNYMKSRHQGDNEADTRIGQTTIPRIFLGEPLSLKARRQGRREGSHKVHLMQELEMKDTINENNNVSILGGAR
jgi:hypothetical protein